MKILCIESADSTNNWLARNEEALPSPCVVRCHTQTAGRGQRGNSWESQPGKNFTGSLLLHPSYLPACKQFILSEAVALAIIATLKEYGIEAKVKWPNDIYVGNKKITGILAEHVVNGRNISRSIVGIGLNVNQEKFFSDAPNPTSMKNETLTEYDIDLIAARLAANIEEYLNRAGLIDQRCVESESPEEKEDKAHTLHEEFLEALWRKDGELYPFVDKIRQETFQARISDVAPDGILTLETASGDTRKYAFKEIEFVI